MKRTAVVVDDDESTRFVLSRALAALGFTALLADDGSEVPDLIHQHAVDLIVIDLYMPGMNGFELLRRIRAADPGFLPRRRTASSVSVIVVSGEGAAASIANARALGADEYLVKPIDLDCFEQSVRRLTDRGRLRDVH